MRTENWMETVFMSSRLATVINAAPGPFILAILYALGTPTTHIHYLSKRDVMIDYFLITTFFSG